MLFPCVLQRFSPLTPASVNLYHTYSLFRSSIMCLCFAKDWDTAVVFADEKDGCWWRYKVSL